VCVLLLAASAGGCAEDDEGETMASTATDGSEGSDTMTASGDSQSTATTSATSNPGTSDPGTTDPTQGSGSMSGSGDDTSGADTGSGVSCEPEDGDDACNACTKASCCDQLGACFASEACTCMTNCATGLDSIAMCTKMCGASSEFSGLTQCVTVSCAADCI
jgi:hypothetical protein